MSRLAQLLYIKHCIKLVYEVETTYQYAPCPRAKSAG